jgi:hypothetical protein
VRYILSANDDRRTCVLCSMRSIRLGLFSIIACGRCECAGSCLCRHPSVEPYVLPCSSCYSRREVTAARAAQAQKAVCDRVCESAPKHTFSKDPRLRKINHQHILVERIECSRGPLLNVCCGGDRRTRMPGLRTTLRRQGPAGKNLLTYDQYYEPREDAGRSSNSVRRGGSVDRD